MVKTYKRKTSRRDWPEESMNNAVEAVVKQRTGYMLAAKSFSVSQTTLVRKLKIAHANVSATTTKILKGFYWDLKKKVFSDDDENELCNYILDMESRFYDLTVKEHERVSLQLSS